MSYECKTIAKSFRINQVAIEALREEARKQTISLNTLVNQLLVSYTEFGRYMRQMRGVTLPHQTFAEIVGTLFDGELTEVGKRAGKSEPQALITSKHGKMTANAVIELIHFLSSNNNLFEYSEKDENGHWTITLTHELGRRWSLFLASYLEEAFAAAGVKAHYTVSDWSTTFSI